MSNRQLPYSVNKHSLVHEACYLRRGSRRGYNADVEEDAPHSDYLLDHPDDDDDYCEEGGAIDYKQKGSNPTLNTATDRIQFYSHIKPKRRHRHQQKDDSNRTSSTTKRNKKRPHYWTTIHPDIDLSLVSILSSRDLEQRTTTPDGKGGAFAYYSPIPTAATTTTTAGSSSISSSSDATTALNSKKSKNGKSVTFDDRRFASSSKDVIAEARPLAVVDYGSIELDMSGSLLDSIYKIGPPPTTTTTTTSSSASGGGKNKKKHDEAIFMDRTMIDGGVGRKRHRTHFAHCHYESIRSKNRRILQRKSQAEGDDVVQGAGSNTSSVTAPPSSNDVHGSSNSLVGVRSSREVASCAVQVQAMPSGLLGSNHPPRTTTMTTTKHEGTDTLWTTTNREDKIAESSSQAIIPSTKMVEARRMVCGPLPTISKVPTTLEAAISFSPYARVLFCAHPPHTVVYINAAYASLAQQRSVTTKLCSVGGAFSNSTKQLEGESSDSYVARMVMEHMQALDPDHDDDYDEEASRARKIPRPGLFYYIYPVLSVDDPYSEILCGYKHDFDRRQGMAFKNMETSTTVSRNMDAASSSSIFAGTSILSVLPAVEPDGSLSTKNGGIITTSPIQHITQYLLQIEPDGRYP